MPESARARALVVEWQRRLVLHEIALPAVGAWPRGTGCRWRSSVVSWSYRRVWTGPTADASATALLPTCTDSSPSTAHPGCGVATRNVNTWHRTRRCCGTARSTGGCGSWLGVPAEDLIGVRDWCAHPSFGGPERAVARSHGRSRARRRGERADVGRVRAGTIAAAITPPW